MNADDQQANPLPRKSFLPTRRPFLACVLLVVIFAAGAIVGVSSTVIYQKCRPRDRSRSVEAIRDRMTRQFSRRLDLDKKQAGEVAKVIEARLVEIRHLREVIKPQMLQQAEILEEGVKKVLRPDQQAKWEEYYQELHKRWFQPPPPRKEAEQPQ